MLIKSAQYKTCETCGNRKRISDEIFGCDNCGGEYDDNILAVAVYHDSCDSTKHLSFCSWKCVFAKLPELHTDYFIELPCLYFDRPESGKVNVNAFWDAVRSLK